MKNETSFSPAWRSNGRFFSKFDKKTCSRDRWGRDSKRKTLRTHRKGR